MCKKLFNAEKQIKNIKDTDQEFYMYNRKTVQGGDICTDTQDMNTIEKMTQFENEIEELKKENKYLKKQKEELLNNFMNEKKKDFKQIEDLKDIINALRGGYRDNDNKPDMSDSIGKQNYPKIQNSFPEETSEIKKISDLCMPATSHMHTNTPSTPIKTNEDKNDANINIYSDIVKHLMTTFNINNINGCICLISKLHIQRIEHLTFYRCVCERLKLDSAKVTTSQIDGYLARLIHKSLHAGQSDIQNKELCANNKDVYNNDTCNNNIYINLCNFVKNLCEKFKATDVHDLEAKFDKIADDEQAGKKILDAFKVVLQCDNYTQLLPKFKDVVQKYVQLANLSCSK